MRNQENIHQDYTTYSAGYQLSLTMDIQVYIPPHDPVRLLNQLLEGLDDKKLLSTYSDKGRNSVVPPVIMFKILIYAYMNRSLFFFTRNSATLSTGYSFYLVIKWISSA